MRLLAATLLLVPLLGCSDSSSSSSVPGTNLRTAADSFTGKDDLFLVDVSESFEGGVDLNGDGDEEDVVLHVLDLRTGELRNLSVAAAGLPFGSCPACLRAGGTEIEPHEHPRDIVPRSLPKVEGDRIAFVVEEARQGEEDLNGDGDAFDQVLHVYDRTTQTLANVGLAVRSYGDIGFELSDDVLAFTVDEFGQDETDLDGNGNHFGAVLHVLELASGTVSNLGFELGAGDLRVVGQEVGFFAIETAATGDLNGDGDDDQLDEVFHLHDASTGVTTNTGLACFFQHGPTFDGNWTVLVEERAQGMTDLNDNGVAEDLVFHTFQPATGTVTNIGLAPDHTTFAVAGLGVLAMSVDEGFQGYDGNGDGDKLDVVPFVFDPVTGFAASTNVATRGAQAIVPLEDWLLLPVLEVEQGNVDQNLDGDVDDLLLHVFAPITGRTLNPALNMVHFRGSGRYVVMLRDEEDTETDWNRDGDQEDLALQVWNGRTLTTTSTGWSARTIQDARGDRALLTVYEGDEGRDLNGDGDSEDALFAIADLADATVRVLPLGAGYGRLIEGNRAVLLVSEHVQGGDLNGDGDALDLVLFSVSTD
jgi:hypothetical protein